MSKKIIGVTVGTTRNPSWVDQAMQPLIEAIEAHKQDTENPHGVTAEQIGAANTEILGEDNGRPYIITTEVKDGDLDVKVDYQEDITLDSIAYGDKTFRDIFVAGNLIEGGDFENGIPKMNGVDGSYSNYVPIIQSDVYETGSHAMKFYVPEHTSHLKLGTHTFKGGRRYYFAMRSRIDEYTQGALGFGYLTSRFADPKVTLGAWVTTSRIAEPTGDATKEVRFGTFLDASVDGKIPIMTAYVDNICILDLTAIFNDPSIGKAQMDVLYEQYIRILRGGVEEERTYVVPNTSVNAFTDEECVNAFVTEMNRKAKQLGMKNSKFLSPSGLVVNGNGNVSTAADAMKLMIYSFGYERVTEVLMRNSYTFRTCGVPIRGITTKNMLIGGLLSNTMDENGFYFFGGKGGSLGSSGGQGWRGIQNYALMCGWQGKMVAVGVMGDYYYNADETEVRISPFVLDVMKKVSGSTDATPTLDERTGRADQPVSVSACVVPHGNMKAWAFLDADQLIAENGGYSHTPDAPENPASVTKLLTATMVCDYVDNLMERVEIHASDDVGGSGDNSLYAGEKVTYMDLLHLMLLESNNQAATALARAVGHKLLSTGIVIT